MKLKLLLFLLFSISVCGELYSITTLDRKSQLNSDVVYSIKKGGKGIKIVEDETVQQTMPFAIKTEKGKVSFIFKSSMIKVYPKDLSNAKSVEDAQNKELMLKSRQNWIEDFYVENRPGDVLYLKSVYGSSSIELYPLESTQLGEGAYNTSDVSLVECDEAVLSKEERMFNTDTDLKIVFKAHLTTRDVKQIHQYLGEYIMNEISSLYKFRVYFDGSLIYPSNSVAMLDSLELNPCDRHFLIIRQTNSAQKLSLPKSFVSGMPNAMAITELYIGSTYKRIQPNNGDRCSNLKDVYLYAESAPLLSEGVFINKKDESQRIGSALKEEVRIHVLTNSVGYDSPEWVNIRMDKNIILKNDIKLK